MEYVGCMLGKVQKDETGGSKKKNHSKNSLFTSNCEDTTQAVKQRFGVDCLDFLICCCGVFFSQVKAVQLLCDL